MKTPNAALLYACRVRDVHDDLDFIKTFCRNSSVLEIGCGTGRIPEALLDVGITKYVGIDTDPQRLEVCQQRFGSCAKFRLARANFLDVNKKTYGIFDRILLCFNVLSEFSGTENRRRALAITASLLAPGGRVLIALPAPDDALFDRTTTTIRKRFVCNGELWIAEFDIARQASTKTSEVTVRYSQESGLDTSIVTDHYRNEQITREELFSHYAASKLELEKEYGSFSGSSYDSHSQNIIHVLKAKSS
jgi:SAM-dependent methyltransferase